MSAADLPSRSDHPIDGKSADILTFFEVSLDLLFIRDMDGIIRRASPSCYAILGYRPEDICNRRMLDLIHPDDRAFTQSCMTEVEGCQEGQPAISVISRYRHRDGHYLSLEWNAHRLGDKIYGVARDVTEKLAAERALVKARAEAEAANHAKSEFLANMSHEIRTPLNSVIGVADALAHTDFNPLQTEMVELIRSSGQTLTRLMSDILDTSQIEAGRLAIENQPFDMVQALAPVLDNHRLIAEAKGLAFKVEWPGSVTGSFLGDSIRLGQILSNLLSNAIKFTTRGHVLVRLDLSEEVGAPTLLSFVVEDTGIGFDTEQAARLFQRFSQADASITRRFGGSGLGLSICQSLVELMGGHIQARSTSGEGSCFNVELPIPRSRAVSSTDSPRLMLPDRNLRLLVADDHPVNRKLIQLLLGDLPIQFTDVCNGMEAVESFQSGRFDVVLMDMQMPVMDGVRATQAIRAYEASHAFLGRTPIIMVTANALDEHRRMALEAGADLHLTKPLTVQDLTHALTRILGTHQNGPDLTKNPSRVA